MAGNALLRQLEPQIKSNISAVVKYARRKGHLHDHADFELCPECKAELQQIAARAMPNCVTPEARMTVAEEMGFLTEAFNFNRALQENRNRTGEEL